MKKVSNYIFQKNGREIAVFYLNKKQLKKKNLHVYDCIMLQFDAQEGGDKGVYMRPDEALLVAELLTAAVRKSVKAYDMGVERNKKTKGKGSRKNMKCPVCGGNVLGDGKCLQCGRPAKKEFVYKKVSNDSRKKLQGGKFPQ